MGSVMHFQRTLNLLSRGSAPGYLAVFIGGFGDVVAGCLSRVEKRFPGFLPGVAHATAYYHWDGGGFMDVVPRIGGRWGHCAGADANLAFSGYRRDREGRLYSHRRPAPMLYEAPAEETCSLFQAASAWLEGRLPG